MPYQPGQGTNFIPWDRILELNRPGANAMANSIIDPITQKAGAFEKDLGGVQDQFAADQKNASIAPGMMPGGPLDFATYHPADHVRLQQEAADVARRASLAGSTGGQAALLREGVTGAYSTGANRFDAALAGAAGGSRLTGLSGQYGNESGEIRARPVPTPQEQGSPTGNNTTVGPGNKGAGLGDDPTGTDGATGNNADLSDTGYKPPRFHKAKLKLAGITQNY